VKQAVSFATGRISSIFAIATSLTFVPSIKMKMAYRTFQPCPALRPFIRMYWTFDTALAGETEGILRRRIPDGTASVVITIENFSWTDRGNGWRASEGALLQGVCSHAYLLRAQPKTVSFGVIFKPETAYRLFGLPLGELADGGTDLENAFGPAGKTWAEQIRNAAGNRERIQITDAFLLRRLRHSPAEHPYLDKALSLIRASGGSLEVESLSRQLFVGRRQLERQFRQHIGLSPKMMLRIERFRSALNMAKTHPARGILTEIAHACGYADQAHFIRECRDLTNVAPSHLLVPLREPVSTVLF